MRRAFFVHSLIRSFRRVGHRGPGYVWRPRTLGGQTLRERLSKRCLWLQCEPRQVKGVSPGPASRGLAATHFCQLRPTRENRVAPRLSSLRSVRGKASVCRCSHRYIKRRQRSPRALHSAPFGRFGRARLRCRVGLAWPHHARRRLALQANASETLSHGETLFSWVE
jgi:hypothetical protein